MSQNILIIGASSGIAEAFARRYAVQGNKFYLVARNEEKLKLIANDLLIRGAEQVRYLLLDANDYNTLSEKIAIVWDAFGHVDIALIAYGTLPEQALTETDISYAVREFRNNCESVIVCLTAIASRFQSQSKGVIAVIGSVAGDRGRASNHLYGSAKSAVDVFASGLRARLFPSGVHVLVIKPGFVDTPMTKDLQLPQVLVASADQVAVDIIKAIKNKSDVLYTPWFWKYIMQVIRWLPGFIFKRMKF